VIVVDSGPGVRRDLVAEADALRAGGDAVGALGLYTAAAAEYENPPAALCVKLARIYHRLGSLADAHQWVMRVVDGGDDFVSWQAAAAVLGACADESWSAARHARVAVLGSYTTTQFVPLLQLAARRVGVALDTYECAYGQYRQEILDPASSLYRFGPDFIVLMVHERELDLPAISETPDQEIERELARWTTLWDVAAQHSTARVVQCLFAPPSVEPLGHLAARLTGSRQHMLHALNLRLGDAAGNRVSVVDCARLASRVGLEHWFDARYWHLAKHAVAPAMQPLLARHTAAVLAAELGLTRKCLVLDLDNTLWGGVVGEDGAGGVQIGGTAVGEAFADFQQTLLDYKRKGLLLAICSKNNLADAREPFETRPDMRLSLGDFACFVADWRPKAEQVNDVAHQLDLGLDSLVFVDDNPAERELIRQSLPEVEVLTLPDEPAQFSVALAEHPLLETRALTAEDAQRAGQYAARARILASREAATSLDAFHRSLEMEAVVAPFTDADLPRIAQLISKSNQFNLTTRRHSVQRLEEFRQDPHCVHFSLRLRDRFTDHGLVSVLIALQRGTALDIDTWLMSCRVIGRTVEAAMFGELCHAAERRGCDRIDGTYIRSSKNGMVADLFERFGFERARGGDEAVVRWEYDLSDHGSIASPFIQTGSAVDMNDGRS